MSFQVSALGSALLVVRSSITPSWSTCDPVRRSAEWSSSQGRMTQRPLDPETLREVFVYLYRCWLHKHLREIPDRLGLSSEDGALVSSSFSLYFSNTAVTTEAAR